VPGGFPCLLARQISVKNWRSPKTWFSLLSVFLLLVGLGGALLVYQRAEEDMSRVLGYESGEESPSPILPEDSKKYLRDLELYGGKANVLATELRLWFVGLFQGKALAFTLACITIGTSFVVFYMANHLSSRPGPGETGGGNKRHD
jgi:hypothetical protein